MLKTITIQQACFYVTAAMAITGALSVIFSKNPVRAVFSLAFTFLATAGLWMLLAAEFISIILILVYVGAVMVLFLFVIMMLDVELASLREGYARYLPLGILVAILLIGGLSYAFRTPFFSSKTVLAPTVQALGDSNMKALGNLLYTEYLYPFEIAGLLLLVAMITAIVLCLRDRVRGQLATNPSLQMKVQKAERLQIVKMETFKRVS
jgi:NADH-quinone oxidoreductase subunit J